MTDRPIIFSAPMVRALLDGRKTQTRRLLRPQPEGIARVERIAGTARSWRVWPESNRRTVEFKSPAYAPGDRLYVREAFSIDTAGGSSVNGVGDWHYILEYRAGGMADLSHHGYHADDPYVRLYDTQLGDWRPSIHMPRWASRLTLIVTDVRVHRLQQISAEDCTAEGIPFESDALAPAEWSISRFADLWNSLHGHDAWDANPWVCALTFTVHRRNIDQTGNLS